MDVPIQLTTLPGLMSVAVGLLGAQAWTQAFLAVWTSIGVGPAVFLRDSADMHQIRLSNIGKWILDISFEEFVYAINGLHCYIINRIRPSDLTKVSGWDMITA